jgi:hypothetical protein
VAARVSRFWSKAWQEASSAAQKSNPAAKCGQNRDAMSSQCTPFLLAKAGAEASALFKNVLPADQT